MIRTIASILVAALVGAVLAQAQEPAPLVFPKLSGLNLNDANLQASSKDPAKLYSSPREAALAAFQAGYKATSDKRRERAIRLFLLSLHRDPTLVKALYNLALLCAQDLRWEDALNFQKEFQMQQGLDADWLRLSKAELERVGTIARLESTPDGKIRRRFDIALWPVLHVTDPVKGLNEVSRLARVDKNRWEAPALEGIFHAETKAYPESVKALEEAARLASPERAQGLKSAAEAARREANYAEQLKNADSLWEKQQYEPAAKAYETAWNTIPARIETGMQSATGYLMADQVAPAMQLLSRVRDSAAPDVALKISAMLKELSVISDEAKAAAGRIPPTTQVQPPVDTGALVRTLVGSLQNSEIELVVKPEPPLLPDMTTVVGIPDEDITGGHSDLALLTTDSIFGMYKRDLAAAASASASLYPSVDTLTSSDAQQERPVPASKSPIGSNSGGLSSTPVRVTSSPAGATIQVDEDPSLKCVAPCEFQLSPGRHVLHANLSGHDDAARIFNVDKGKALPLDVQLDAKKGSVILVTKVPGLPIYVDGTKTNMVTPRTVMLTEGQHQVGVEIDGAVQNRFVAIKQGAVLSVEW